MIQKDRIRKYSGVAALVLAALLLTFPLRALVAGYCFGRAARLMQDRTGGVQAALAISDKTLQDYTRAVRSLEVASALVPARSQYHKALSDAYIRLGVWAESMEGMHEALPAGAVPAKDAFGKAAAQLRTAIELEPGNPDYHYALGCLYDMTDRTGGQSEKELARAVEAAPTNAPLRYAVAWQHLTSGRRGDALEQAAVLLKIDDTGEWIFRALEIAWRASGDPAVVMGIAADGPEAEMAKQFLKSKGIGKEKSEE